MSLASENNLTTNPENITTKFRDAFESFTNGINWNLTKASGDIVQLDGNAVSASYIVISKDPLSTNTLTTLETIDSFDFPLELSVGMSTSQRILGQEVSMELVSTETPLSEVSDIAISSISQSTTTLSVTTSAPHGLVVGKRIGIFGVTSDSRLNYPSLVIATTNSPTTFTCTAGPGGTIPTLTVGPYTSQGYVYFRPALGYAQNGMSEIFESASTTSASVYVRSHAGDSLPSGTPSGNHSQSCASLFPNQPISAAYAYTFLPSSEYKFVAQADRVQWLDAGVDTTSAPTIRTLRTQVVPDPAQRYKLRFRSTNNKGLTVPNAKIVSQVKSGSTVATVTTASDHGLTTGDWVVLFGTRDVTNFQQVGSAVQVLSTPTTTAFTTAYGTSVTATSYGGFVARVQGGNIPAGFGTVALIAAQSAFTAGLTNELQIIGSGNWSASVGDYVNVYGLRNNTDGGDLGVDGVYRVVDLSTTTIRLAPIDGATLPSFTSTNCGGTIIKRTDVRISYARVFDYSRQRVEVQATSAQAASVPIVGTVNVNGGSNIIPFNQNSYALQTTTNLASSATYTQTTQNTAASTTSATNYNTQLVIGVTHTAGLTPGQLYLDVGTENSSTVPTVWYTALAVPIPSNANWQQFTVPISTRYYRLRFVNGATAQTNFRLSTFLTYNGGGLSNQYAVPMNIQYPLSTTTIGANGTQTSPTLDFGDSMNIYQTITAIVYSDQASATNGLQIQLSRDGTNWRVAQQTTVAATTLTSLTAHLSYRYARIVYTNGATIQTIFNLDAHVDAQ